MSLFKIKKRNRVPEWMDQPNLDVQMHQSALQSLGRINAISRVVNLLWNEIKPFSSQTDTLTLLDIGSGGGDTTISLAKIAQQQGVDIIIKGADMSQVAVDFANKKAEDNQLKTVQFFQMDVLEETPTEQFDIVMCSLFMHHFDDPNVLKILTMMRASAKHAVLVDDLSRSALGYSLAWLGCRLLSRSPIVHFDGPASVAGAYTSQEFRELAEQSGLANIQLKHHWPQRFLLIGRV